MTTKTKNLSLFSLLAFIALSLSQTSSYLINENLSIGETHVVNFLLHFTHIRNHGAIFGSFEGKGFTVALLSAALLIALVIYLSIAKSLKRYEYLCFGLIVGAGSSNILDRFIYGSVIDFINVQHIPYWGYIFNTADTLIHIGVWPLLLFTLFSDNESTSTE